MVRVAVAWWMVMGVVGVARSGPSPSTRITVWSAPHGGATYGGLQPFSGAMIAEQREIEVTASGEIRVTGVAATAEAASVQLRDLTEPGLAIREQRYVPGATTPTQLLARRIGETVTLVTQKGDVTGVLRAVDEHALVIESGRSLSILRRDTILDARVPAKGGDTPSIVARAAPKKPGKHRFAISYRASGIAWRADYHAVLDDATRTIDFTAWATIRNHSGAAFERAELTLISGKPQDALRFDIPTPVSLGVADTVQVELARRSDERVRTVIAYEAMADLSSNQQDEPNQDCTFHASGGGRAKTAIELAVPATLPAGRVRLFKRSRGRLELVTEDALRSVAGVARIELAGASEITGERKAVTCTVDERTHTLVEKVEIRVDNKSKHARDVVLREFLWRWPVWKLDSEDRKSVRAGAQAIEYRLEVPARGSQTVTYTVSYTW